MSKEQARPSKFSLCHVHTYKIFKRFYLFIFRERGGREKEGEGNINVWLPFPRPLLGTWLATQAYTLTGNPTSNTLVHRPALSPLSHTNQGHKKFLASWFQHSPGSLLLHFTPPMKISPRPQSSVRRKRYTGLGRMVLPNFSR